MFTLTSFSLKEMTACAATLRRLGDGARSLEDAAGRITQFLYQQLTTSPDARPACALVRLFKTHPYERLTPELKALADARLGEAVPTPDMTCLTLLGSAGAVPGWNDPGQSSRFRIIPLASRDTLSQLPMFSQLFSQFGIDLPHIQPPSTSVLIDQEARTFNVFYVPEAAGSPFVPAQESFVVPFGIRSVLGFGGLLATGEMFAVVLFATVPVPQETAERLKPLALATKLALAPFEHDRLILPTQTHGQPAGTPADRETLTLLKERVTALESLLAVQEQTVASQSHRLEASLAESRQQTKTLQAQSLRFETLSATSPTGIFQTDETGAYLYTNTTWQTITGCSFEESLGHQWTTLIVEDEHDRVVSAWQHAVQHNLDLDLEYRLQHRNGTIRWVHRRSRPLVDETGQIIGHVGTTEDVTDRKQAEASRLKLQLAIDHTHDGIALLNETGHYTYMNPSHASIYGYRVEELMGHNWTMLYDREWATMIEQLYLPILLSEGHWQGEVIGRKKSGDAFHVELSLALLGEPGTDHRTTICTCRDISRRKQMEQDLHTAKDAAEAGARAKSEFLAKMSHEIRTPMNGVLGMTTLLLDTGLTPEQRDLVETLKDSGESLLTIINDILDFSKIEAGKLELDPIPFDVRALFDQVLDLYAVPAQQKHLGLNALVHPNVPTKVIGDPGRIKQIVNNLVSNALKFTETGEINIQVSTLPTSPEHTLIRVEVTDTGIGIPDEAFARLFQSFSQADSSMSRRFGGTGLGLAICKQLVELMHGQLYVESTPGQGSRFWFDLQLPLAPDAALTAAPTAELAGRRLALVSEHALSRRILSQYATRWHMDACPAGGADEALALLRAEQQAGRMIDAALVDLQLPGTTGLALTAAMKADPLLRDIPVILLSSMGQRGDGKASAEAGAAAYLTKPIRERQFADCLRLVLGQPRQAGTRPPLITRHTLSEQPTQAAQPFVLVVDDNAVNRKVATKMLEKMGCRIAIATNGREAVDAFARTHYDLVFMDCQMPEMDGFEATQKIRAQENGQARRLPIIAMTANAMQSDREHCLAAGMDDFVSKPINAAVLTTMLARWLPDEHPAAPPSGTDSREAA